MKHEKNGKLPFWQTISVKWKLYLFLASFVFFIIALLWVLQVMFLDNFYQSIKTGEIKRSAQKIVQNIDSGTLEELVQKSALDGDMSIIVATEEGKVKHAAEGKAGSLIFRMPVNQFYTLMQLAKENGGEYMEYFSGFGITAGSTERSRFIQRGETPLTMLYVRTATAGDGTQYVVLVNTNITPVDATVQTIRWQLFSITLILLLTALLLALLISKFISAPIMKLNDATKELAKGRYDIPFTGSGYREISELSQSLNTAATELSKVDKLKDELIANISHDLRTPLTLITGYSEMMRDLPLENTPENLQVVVEESKRLTSLVNDMMDISKLKSGAQVLNIARFNLTKSIQDIAERFTRLTEKDGYAIRFEGEGEVFVAADEMRISQVVYNLVNNAISYTGADKQVCVRQKINGGTVRIEVRDTGEGIEQEKLADIWERYYKLDKNHKRAVTGTGLGLSIVKTIFDMHNMRYGIISELGRGSVFWFELAVDGNT